MFLKNLLNKDELLKFFLFIFSSLLVLFDSFQFLSLKKFFDFTLQRGVFFLKLIYLLFVLRRCCKFDFFNVFNFDKMRRKGLRPAGIEATPAAPPALPHV